MTGNCETDEINILFTLELEQTELMKSSYFSNHFFFFIRNKNISFKERKSKINTLQKLIVSK